MLTSASARSAARRMSGSSRAENSDACAPMLCGAPRVGTGGSAPAEPTVSVDMSFAYVVVDRLWVCEGISGRGADAASCSLVVGGAPGALGAVSVSALIAAGMGGGW